MSKRESSPSESVPNNLAQLKLVPFSLEAEQSILGILMLDNDLWDDVTEIISENDFYHKVHRLIFREMRTLLAQGKPIDLITLTESLEIKDKLETAGSFAYVAELSKSIPGIANYRAYAEIIRERAIVREMISAGNQIVDAGYNTAGRNSDELLDTAEKLIFELSERRSATAKNAVVSIAQALESTVSRIELLYSNPHDGVTGVNTGFNALNEMTSGFQSADLVIIAARPSMGKTTFAMNICENAAMVHDKPVLIFSLEMPKEHVMMRLLASQSRVDLSKIMSGKLEDEDWAKISSTMALLLQKDNILIDDSSGLTPEQLRTRARRAAREHGGLSMIMLDYLQLMRVPGSAYEGNRTLEIAEITRSLKSLAKELNVPVVALSQLNRALEQRADKRPINSDLRESGSIEQDADVIMFIYRDEVYDEMSADRGVAEIIIGKQRNGPIGSLRLRFQGHFSRFDDL
ncbi:replicative DNA helicase (plasmid) [Pantoea sp. BJ2]|uniref:Replicative DNA helicase n=1 Tax=Pantoea sp. BJ2 TaxID=3141322 RepID=A0AAU7U388_9GAMM